MSDWDEDKDFSGTDWDGNGKIDAYDYEFDKEVYSNASSTGTRFTKNDARIFGGAIGAVLLAIIIGLLLPILGTIMLIGLWLIGFGLLVSWVFH